MAQQPHFSGMRRAYWHSWLFNPIHSYLIDPYGYNDDAQSIETFISDHNPTNTRAAMDFPDFEDGSSDSASQDTDTVVPMLYNVNNVVTSDVIVRFDGGRREFLSEKRTLSAVSGYFKHAFSGNFSVATSDVIDLGDEDNAKHIYAMLCFIHGFTYTRIHQRNAVGRNLDFHIDLFLLGEQYDICNLRYAAAMAFFREASFFVDAPWFPLAVQRVIGPDAPVFADQFLVEMTIKVCNEQVARLVDNEQFVEMARAGELADEETMVELFLALGQRVRNVNGHGPWKSNEERLAEAQTELLVAETAVESGPFNRSTLRGQIMAARAQNAAWAALTNRALLGEQPTWAPPPAVLASQVPPAAALASNPPPVGRPAVARIKTGFTKIIRTKASLLKKALSSRFTKV